MKSAVLFVFSLYCGASSVDEASSDDNDVSTALESMYASDPDFAELIDDLQGDMEPVTKRLRMSDSSEDVVYQSIPSGFASTVGPIRGLPTLRPLMSSPLWGVVMPPTAASEYVMFLARQGKTPQAILDHLVRMGITHDTNIMVYVNRLYSLMQIDAVLFKPILASIAGVRRYNSLRELVLGLRATSSWVPSSLERQVVFFLLACIDANTWINMYCRNPETIAMNDGSPYSVYRIPNDRLIYFLRRLPDQFLLTAIDTVPSIL